MSVPAKRARAELARMELCVIIVLRFIGFVGRKKSWNKVSKTNAEVGLTENVKVRLTIGLDIDSARVNPGAPKFEHTH